MKRVRPPRRPEYEPVIEISPVSGHKKSRALGSKRAHDFEDTNSTGDVPNVPCRIDRSYRTTIRWNRFRVPEDLTALAECYRRTGRLRAAEEVERLAAEPHVSEIGPS